MYSWLDHLLQKGRWWLNKIFQKTLGYQRVYYSFKIFEWYNGNNMGGSSTSHSAVLGSQKAKSSSAFDMHSWQGLTELLRVGKELLPDSAEYAEFRNLVLEYAQKGGDLELRKKIDAIVIRFSKDTSHTESYAKNHTEQNKEKHTKEVKKVPPDTYAVPAELVQGSEERHEEINIPDTNLDTKSEKTGKLSFGTTTRRIPPRFVSFKESDEVVVHEMLGAVHEEIPDAVLSEQNSKRSKIEKDEREEIVSEKITDIKSDTLPVSTDGLSPVAPVPASFKTVEEYKARISEIKRMVHEHMGNPAALMNTHNDLGKKYMTALLGALKATGAGSTEAAEVAMVRLETAYEALKNDVPKLPKQEILQEVAQELPQTIVSEEEKVITDIPTHTAPTAPVVPSPLVEKENDKDMHVQEESTSWISRDVPATFEKSDETITSAVKAMYENTSFAAQTLKPVHTHEEDFEESPKEIFSSFEKDKDTKTNNQVTENITEEILTTPVLKPRVSTESRTKHTFKGIGKTTHAHGHGHVVNTADVASRQSELFSPHINHALHQLLQDWSIFGSSGIFGIGPGGAEHPLYETLAPLSMGEVLAGRWEKADHKIIKIIKQYVDAWRHEQGVAHTPNETFEHYLRRVIQRILKRQNIE